MNAKISSFVAGLWTRDLTNFSEAEIEIEIWIYRLNNYWCFHVQRVYTNSSLAWRIESHDSCFVPILMHI
jgi:hypothetical protein